MTDHTNAKNYFSLAHLSPSYFGMVMATGIISICSSRLGLPTVGKLMFFLNIGLYVLLWVLYLLRAYKYTNNFVTDFISHNNSFGFFTTVAATSILGSQFLEFYHNNSIAIILLTLAIILWVCLTYLIFTFLVIKENKPSLREGINGGWLLAVVATQSIAVLSGLISIYYQPDIQLMLNFLAFSTWLFGGMLYIWMMSLIFFRYVFFSFQPTDLAPPYWINMGAMAISTLAGCILLGNVNHAPFLQSTEHFIIGFTVFYWATGTWWIPMLILLGIWRYIFKKSALSYDPLYWGAVFPLGMYATCTLALLNEMHMPFLTLLPQIFLTFALLAWALTTFGACHRAIKSIRYAFNS